MYEVQFIREGITAKAQAGESLLEVMRHAGLTPDAPCGGRGRCGKCAVKLCGGKDTIVKSCVFSVCEDLIVDTMGAEASANILTGGVSHGTVFDPVLRQIRLEVPPCPAGQSVSDWSRFSDSLRKTVGSSWSGEAGQQVVLNKTDVGEKKTASDQERDLKEVGNAVGEASENMDKTAAGGKNAADGEANPADRKAAWTGDGGAAVIPASPEIASKLGPILKKTKGSIWAVVCEDEVINNIQADRKPAKSGNASMGSVSSVSGDAAGSPTSSVSGAATGSPASSVSEDAEGSASVLESRTYTVLDVTAERQPFYMAAFDIGTTTVVGYLLRGEDGSEAAVASRMNPQVQYGADVINRANYSLEHGMEELSGCIQAAVNEMLAEMAKSAETTPEQIYLVSIAGNTCMHHLFLGICVDSLVHAPYNPAVAEPMILRASDYGLHINPRGQIMMLPNIAGFVGADTVACLVSSDLANQKEWTLLIDIGTNGEVVLGRDHKMISCSTAAGPAFEGSRISRGMRGAPGAVNSVKWENGAWKCTTIGDQKARGICGSGLLDLAAELWRSGQISETGELRNGREIVLVPAEETEDGRELALIPQDIGELQLAKAAIAAGVRLLAEKMSVPLNEIKQVWLAGAFGSFLSPESACTIGLIPPELRGRISAIGNAAGEGARQVLQNRAMWERAAFLAAETEFLELAGLPEFQDYFVDELEFPEL